MATTVWASGLLVALMVSRALNIFVIKQRSRTRPQVLPPPSSQPIQPAATSRMTQYIIDVDPDTTAILRGLSADLQALTTTVWLLPKTRVEGYLEATAKVLVYLVAACSGNVTQAGNLVMLLLVLASAGLPALSNAQVKGLRNGGGVVAPSPAAGDDKLTGGKGGRCGVCSHASGGNPTTDKRSVRLRGVAERWPLGSDVSSMSGMEDSVEKGEAGDALGRSYVYEDPVNHRVQLDTRLGTLEVVARRDRDQRNRGTY